MNVRQNSKKPDLKESPLFWPANLDGKVLRVLDETLIPSSIKYVSARHFRDSVSLIRDMKTRAFGQLLVVLYTFLLELRNSPELSQAQLMVHLQRVAKALNESRPTFPFSEVTGMILHWAHTAMEAGEDLRIVLERNVNGYLGGIRVRRHDRVRSISKLMKNGDTILTHCNVSGELAMAAWLCLQQKKKVRFFATETRPYLQGAKLTCWELERMGADVTLICDNAVASVMADGLITKVIVGSDRNCANGDFANKIGTYQIAVLAQEFGVPFYVLTQPSTKIKTGFDIPIEIRDEKELLVYSGKRFAGSGVKGFYPGFDIVPHQLVTGAVPINVN